MSTPTRRLRHRLFALTLAAMTAVTVTTASQPPVTPSSVPAAAATASPIPSDLETGHDHALRAARNAVPLPKAIATKGRGYRVGTTRVRGRTLALRWDPCQVITYKINPKDLPKKSRGALLRETKSSFADASRASGLRFRYRGTTDQLAGTETGKRQAADILIAFVKPHRTKKNLRGSIVGRAGTSYITYSSPQRNRIVVQRGWILIDAMDMFRHLHPGMGAGPSRGNLLRHEIGHVVGLEHINNPSMLMNPSLNYAMRRGFSHANDRRGMRAVGKAAGCNAAVNGLVDLK